MKYLTQKITQKMNYEQISKEEDTKHITLDHEILRLKRNNRELIRMKTKLEKSIKRENDSYAQSIIKSQIKKLESKITNNNAFRENALQLRQELRIPKKNYKMILETIRNHCTES